MGGIDEVLDEMIEESERHKNDADGQENRR
jgi:hypothetical protein